MDERLHHHCQIVADAAREGEVVFLLGAGANLCGRPAGVKWQAGGPYLPTGGELAEYLAMRYRMPHTERPDLARVAQYVAAERGSAKLSKELHTLFDVECAPTALHMLLARLPGLLEQSGSPAPYQFIVTTNYDDVLERAFRESGARFDLFVYQASGPDHGRLKHHPFDGEPHVITEPNRLVDIGSDRSVILKIHGAIDRKDALHDSWVITEQHYVDYLTQTDISTWLPVGLARRLQESNLECLGYSLRDWNLRAIFRRLRMNRAEQWKWWAVQLESDELDRYVWMRDDLEIIDARLEDYVTELDACLGALTIPAGAP